MVSDHVACVMRVLRSCQGDNESLWFGIQSAVHKNGGIEGVFGASERTPLVLIDIFYWDAVWCGMTTMPRNTDKSVAGNSKKFRSDTWMGVIKCWRERPTSSTWNNRTIYGNGLFRLPLQQHTDTLRNFFRIVRVDDNHRNKRSIPTCKQQRAA